MIKPSLPITNSKFPNKLNFQLTKHFNLRYGENPHQQGWAYPCKTVDRLSLFRFIQIQGKKLSFNNYLDIDAAVNCLCLIGKKKPTCVIIKHTNPCGVCLDQEITSAFIKAWNSDPLAAFGGVIAINREIDHKLAQIILSSKKFFEILVAPTITQKAKQLLKTKKKLIIFINPELINPKSDISFDLKKVRGGFLFQPPDNYIIKRKNLKIVTRKRPTSIQMRDMLSAWNIVRISKANAVCLVKNQQLIGNGTGQQDRVRCCQLATIKAGSRSKGSVAASDAFFPFPDAPKILLDAGIAAIIQPGGSIRDQQTIDLCNKYSVSMVFTDRRGFKH